MTRCSAPATFLGLALAIAGAALPAAAREVSGAAGYLPRIALHPGAQLVVELSGPAGIVAEFRDNADGRQVPLPFTVSTEDEGALFLRAAILLGGAAEWVSPLVPVPAGSEAVDLGLLTLDPFVPMGFATRLRCGETVIEAGFFDEEARMRVGGRVYSLPLAISASGARFTDGRTPETTLWTKGNGAFVTIEGVDLPECEAVAMPSPLPFTARGNEPGWVLNVSAEGMVLGRQDGSEIRASLPAADVGAEGTVLAAPEMTVTVAPSICHDSMTGMPYPQSVTVRLPDGPLTGCGGDPADLLQGRWRVQEIGGAAVPADAEVTLEVSGGHVAGKAGCNRYGATLHLGGEGITIAPGPMTMMACDEGLMALEQDFIAALQRVSGFGFDPKSGALLLSGAEGPALAAVPAP